MALNPAPGEQYTIRRKVFKVFGAGFHIYAADGQLAGYCKQKAFKLKEDLRVFTNESQADELFRISARSVIDFGATYDVKLPSGESLGSIRRKGLASLMRDTWLVFGPSDNQIASLKEDSGTKAMMRRLLGDYSSLMPQSFSLQTTDGRTIATYRTHFNLFIYRLGITIHTEDDELDDLVVLAAGCLLAAIEGRQ
jgi:hypothetical protein